MWLSRQMKAPAPTADADLGMTTITGDSVGVVTRGEVRALQCMAPAAMCGCRRAALRYWLSKVALAGRSSAWQDSSRL